MKKVMKYMMVLLAVGFMGLSVHASATPEVMTAAAAATEVAADADIDLGESLMNFVEQSGISGIFADWRVLVMLIISCVFLCCCCLSHSVCCLQTFLVRASITQSCSRVVTFTGWMRIQVWALTV